jgi:hypothetical protein
MVLGVIVLGAVIGWATVGLLRDLASLSGCHVAAGSDFELVVRILASRIPLDQFVTVARPCRDCTDFRNGVVVGLSYHTEPR